MQDVTVIDLEADGAPAPETLVREAAPAASQAAARHAVEAAGLERPGLRMPACKTDGRAAAARRTFLSQDAQMASAAADGFRDLTDALRAAANGPEPAIGV